MSQACMKQQQGDYQQRQSIEIEADSLQEFKVEQTQKLLFLNEKISV